jgi:cytochrome c peroxidase
MHDGRFKTLDEVIDFYSEGVKISPYISPLMQFASTSGVQLSKEGKKALKAFLLCLHDEKFITNSKFSKPKTFPDGAIQ